MRNQAVDTMHVDISWQVFCDGEHKNGADAETDEEGKRLWYGFLVDRIEK